MLNFLDKFWNKKSFGIYITDNYIQAFQLQGNIDKPEIFAIGEQNLPSEIIRDGQILQEKALATEIKNFLLKTLPNPITSKKCMLALPEVQSFEHIFYLPANLKDKELKLELDRLIQEIIPIPFFDLKYNSSISLHGKTQAVFVTAAKRMIIAQYYQVLKDYCFLEPIVFEPASLSLLRNISLDFTQEKEFILIDISDDKIVWFTIFEGNIFDSSIFNGKDKKLLLEDIQDSIANFNSTTEVQLSKIFVSGNKIKADDLMKTLETNINLSITFIDNYKIAPKINAEDDSSRFKIVAGLALKTLGVEIGTKINLL